MKKPRITCPMIFVMFCGGGRPAVALRSELIQRYIIHDRTDIPGYCFVSTHNPNRGLVWARYWRGDYIFLLELGKRHRPHRKQEARELQEYRDGGHGYRNVELKSLSRM